MNGHKKFCLENRLQKKGEICKNSQFLLRFCGAAKRIFFIVNVIGVYSVLFL
jgi:hypothetical protein